MYQQWRPERARAWYEQQPWNCGFNYLPHTAVNWLEMWQADTFDPVTISQELAWAQRYGYNSLRTNLPFTVWEHDRCGLMARLDNFLTLAAQSGMTTILTLLDDCAFSGDEPFIGQQKPPLPGIHNSQGAGSPGRARVMDPQCWPQIEKYVKDVIGHFRDDPRVQVWDLYNEPGNSSVFREKPEGMHYDKLLGIHALSLMVKLFGWAREVCPTQPLTVAAWHIADRSRCDNAFTHPVDIAALHLSDVISFHAYVDQPGIQNLVTQLEAFGRPLLCTEWLARHIHSRMEEQLPLFYTRKIASYHWGLVQGKTQTWLPWPDIVTDRASASQWFHDVLTPSGVPYCENEMSLVTELTARAGND